MPISIRYKPNNVEFGKLMMAQQTQDLADEAAGAGMLVATGLAQGYGLPDEYITSIRPETGPPMTFAGNPRRTARLVANYPWIEFGSGKGSKSGPRGRKRPQGGYSKPYRVLGRTGSKIGKKPTGRGGF